MTKSRLHVALATIGTVLTTFSPLSAQHASPAPVQQTPLRGDAAPPATYGTAGNIIHNLQPEDFSVWFADWSLFSVHSNFIQNGSDQGLIFSAPLHLPSGAVVDSFEYFYYDDSTTTNPSAELRFVNTLGILTESAPVNFFPNVSHGSNSLLVVLQTPVTINNLTTHYSLRVSLNNGNGSHLLIRVRVNYRLQVSPAPGTATFDDVPVGDPLHRFVEALVAAGITSGCGGGNYCPNAPLTRGQMAVFLSAALGLHWPN